MIHKFRWSKVGYMVCSACGYREGELMTLEQKRCNAGSVTKICMVEDCVKPAVPPTFQFCRDHERMAVKAALEGSNPSGQKAATVPTSSHLSISIESIPHEQHRYDTVGDWFTGASGETLLVQVSELADRREMWLVAIHELVEAFLCECAGITESQVDHFDLNQAPCTGEEPGDDPEAPYYHQHQIATGIERILAAEAGVSWLEYEQHIKELGKDLDYPNQIA